MKVSFSPGMPRDSDSLPDFSWQLVTLTHSLCVHFVFLSLAHICWMSLLAPSDFVSSPVSWKLLSLSFPLWRCFLYLRPWQFTTSCIILCLNEHPVPLKNPLSLLCFSKIELLRLRMRSSEGSASSSLLKFSYFLRINTVLFHRVSRHWVLLQQLPAVVLFEHWVALKPTSLTIQGIQNKVFNAGGCKRLGNIWEGFWMAGKRGFIYTNL